MAAFAGRLAEVYVSTDGSTFVDVERVVSPRMMGAGELAEASSNDSAQASREFISTWSRFTTSFSMIADEAAPGQEMVWAAFLTRTTFYARIRPRGTEGLAFTYRCVVTQIGKESVRDGAAVYRVLLECSDPSLVREDPDAGPVLVAIPDPEFYATLDIADISGNDLGGRGSPMRFHSLSGAASDFAVPGSLPGKTGIHFDPVLHQHGEYGGLTLAAQLGDFTVFSHAKLHDTWTFLLSSFFTLGSHHIEQFLTSDPTYAHSQEYSAFRNNGPPNWATSANFGTVGIALNTWADCAQVVDRTADSIEAFTNGVSVGSASLDPATHGVPLYDLGASSTICARVSAFSNIYRETTLAEFIIWKRKLTASMLDTMHSLRLQGTSLKEYNGY